MRLLILLMVLIAVFAVTEGAGFTTVVTTTATGSVIDSSTQRRFIRNPEGGGREREVLWAVVSYQVGGQRYRIAEDWTDDFWVTNGNFARYTQMFAKGKQVDVVYLRALPHVARLRTPFSWGKALGASIGICILGSFIGGVRLGRRAGKSND